MALIMLFVTNVCLRLEDWWHAARPDFMDSGWLRRLKSKNLP